MKPKKRWNIVKKGIYRLSSTEFSCDISIASTSKVEIEESSLLITLEAYDNNDNRIVDAFKGCGFSDTLKKNYLYLPQINLGENFIALKSIGLRENVEYLRIDLVQWKNTFQTEDLTVCMYKRNANLNNKQTFLSPLPTVY